MLPEVNPGARYLNMRVDMRSATMAEFGRSIGSRLEVTAIHTPFAGESFDRERIACRADPLQGSWWWRFVRTVSKRPISFTVLLPEPS